MFLIIGIPSIKLSELAVDLSQRNIFVFILQACLRRQEYKRDPNEKKRDQFWGQETNFERSRFSSGSSSKQVLRTLGDTFCCRGCVCMCVCEEFQRAGQGETVAEALILGTTPTRPAPPLLRDPPSSPCWVSLFFPIYKGYSGEVPSKSETLWPFKSWKHWAF